MQLTIGGRSSLLIDRQEEKPCLKWLKEAVYNKLSPCWECQERGWSMIFKHTLSFHLPVILFCKLFRFVCASKAAVKSSWAKRKISLSVGFGFQNLSLDFFPLFFPFFFPLLPFQTNIPLIFKYTNTQAEEKQCSQVEKMLLCERMQRILTWGGKHSLKLF